MCIFAATRSAFRKIPKEGELQGKEWGNLSLKQTHLLYRAQQGGFQRLLHLLTALNKTPLQIMELIFI